MRSPWPNVGLMMLGQGTSLAANMISVSFAALIGASLAPTPALATLPQAMMLVGVACATAPMSLLMGRWGRRVGFLVGAGVGMLAASLAIFAITRGVFALYCLATFIIGTYSATGQYYRFAAAEAVMPHQAPKAIAAVLMGGILAALTVPSALASARVSLPLSTYASAYGAVVAYAALALLPALAARFAPVHRPADKSAPGVPLKAIFRRPIYLAGIATAAGGYAMMTLLMTATPLAMAHAGHTIVDSTYVIQAHEIAMFLPSLISGWLIARFGVTFAVALGLGAMVGAMIAGNSGLGVGHFKLALVLVGLGWNFLYVAGTAMVASSLAADERARGQGVNDLCVFATAASTALLSGAIFTAFGWSGLVACGGLLVLAVAGANIARLLLRPARATAPAP